MTTFTLYEDYTPPAWSQRPKLNYYLEVIKDGTPSGEQQIDQKAMYLVGKHGEICDIVLENPTISRKHAVIQSKNTDEIFLFDLKSTHGTFVNGVKIPSKLFHKLKPYDQIRFGQSKRIYILRCSSLENETIEKEEQKIKEKFEKRQARKDFKSLKEHYLSLLSKDPNYAHLKRKRQRHQPDEEEDGINWGIQDEEEVYRYQQEQEYPLEPDVLRQLPGLTTAMMDKIAKYAEKLTVYRTSTDELEEIQGYEKKNYGLDEGRQKRKTQILIKVDELGSELESLEVSLKAIIFGERVDQRQNKDVQDYRDSSEDDEYYDNTLVKKVKMQDTTQKAIPLEKTTETFTELKLKLEQLMDDRMQVNDDLLNLKNNEEKQVEDEDELDTFMKQTAINIASEERPKLLNKLVEISKQIELVSGQLKQVKPDIIQVMSFFGEDKLDKNQKGEVEEELEHEKQNKPDKITQRLQELKQLQEQEKRKQQYEEEEEDDDVILEKARKELQQQEDYQQKKLEQKLKQQRYQNKPEQQQRGRSSSEEEEQSGKGAIKSKAPKSKPHSRHYKESETDQGPIVDLVKYC